MKTTLFNATLLPAALLGFMALATGCAENGTLGTSHEMSHTESDQKGWFGGTTHQANTVYKNSDGSTSIETETSASKDGKTTITRERKTTDLDGKVHTDKETRTLVRGSDNVVTESTTSQ